MKNLQMSKDAVMESELASTSQQDTGEKKSKISEVGPTAVAVKTHSILNRDIFPQAIYNRHFAVNWQGFITKNIVIYRHWLK